MIFHLATCKSFDSGMKNDPLKKPRCSPKFSCFAFISHFSCLNSKALTHKTGIEFPVQKTANSFSLNSKILHFLTMSNYSAVLTVVSCCSVSHLPAAKEALVKATLTQTALPRSACRKSCRSQIGLCHLAEQ